MGGVIGPAIEQEIERVRAAFRAAADMAGWEAHADTKARTERPALQRLMRAWAKLDTEERAAVALELARIVSPEADPHDLDVGVAASRAAEFGFGRAGAKVRAPGFAEAIDEAARIWGERGNPVPPD